ncbi:hypothetical protein DL98DRAFT_66244 [Cadophora sp. DSE1049]|nr:hypothetical protein DL98DRAFT_66244 [Cadophora sp. DSE1049]
MVGRLYKVRCRECRRRKIKCPAEQPGCSRCLKNGFICPGYEEKELEFVNTTGQDLVTGRGNKRSKSTHILQSKEAIKHVSSTKGQEVLPCCKGNRCHQTRPSLDTKAILNSPTTAAANLMQLFAICTNLDFKFFVVIPSQIDIVGNWFVDLPSYAFDDPLLEHALQAVTLIHLGKASNDQNILRNGRQCYGTALNGLQAAARRQRTDAKMLAVCNIMCLYELYDSVIAQAGGFMEHIKGAQILGMAINASNLTQSEEIKCYYVFKTLAIYNSCGARKGCPLAYTKRPPFPADINGPGITNFYEHLEDITIFIPELVERSDASFFSHGAKRTTPSSSSSAHNTITSPADS